MGSGLAFANSTITEKEINVGLEFCKEYPVNLKVNGEIIVFESSDVPPVIITPVGHVNGWTLVPARAVFEAMGATVEWNNDLDEVIVLLDGSVVKLLIGSQTATVDGVEKTLDIPALIIDHDNDSYGSTMIPVRFTAEAIGCKVEWITPTRTIEIEYAKETGADSITGVTGGAITTPSGITTGLFPAYDMSPLPMLSAIAQQKLIVLDFGHGGRDPGSIGHEGLPDQLYEKDLNLKVGLKLKALLEQCGAKVYAVRETDVNYTLLERAAVANDRNATLFVSIHNNSNDYEAPNGTEVHYYSKVDADGNDEKTLYGIESKTVAKNTQSELIKAFGTVDRGIKSSPKLAVLNKTYMPAIIIEGAFLSNEQNLKLMQTDEFVERYAYAAAKAIIKSMNEAYE